MHRSTGHTAQYLVHWKLTRKCKLARMLRFRLRSLCAQPRKASSQLLGLQHHLSWFGYMNISMLRNLNLAPFHIITKILQSRSVCTNVSGPKRKVENMNCKLIIAFYHFRAVTTDATHDAGTLRSAEWLPTMSRCQCPLPPLLLLSLRN